jgi:ankyrin repeat protein
MEDLFGDAVDLEDLLEAAANVNGVLATIKRLHAEGVDVMTERDTQEGFTAIMFAAMNGHATTVIFLQAAGASVVEENKSGHSALHLAMAYGKIVNCPILSPRGRSEHQRRDAR